MTSLTINIEEPLKATAQRKAQRDGVTLTFVVVQALKAYNEDKLNFGLQISEPEVETLEVTPSIQKKMDQIAVLLEKI